MTDFALHVGLVELELRANAGFHEIGSAPAGVMALRLGRDESSSSQVSAEKKQKAVA